MYGPYAHTVYIQAILSFSASEGHAGDFYLLPAVHMTLLETCVCKNLLKAQLFSWHMHIAKVQPFFKFLMRPCIKKHNHSSFTHIKPNSLMG